MSRQRMKRKEIQSPEMQKKRDWRQIALPRNRVWTTAGKRIKFRQKICFFNFSFVSGVHSNRLRVPLLQPGDHCAKGLHPRSGWVSCIWSFFYFVFKKRDHILGAGVQRLIKYLFQVLRDGRWGHQPRLHHRRCNFHFLGSQLSSLLWTQSQTVSFFETWVGGSPMFWKKSACSLLLHNLQPDFTDRPNMESEHDRIGTKLHISRQLHPTTNLPFTKKNSPINFPPPLLALMSPLLSSSSSSSSPSASPLPTI